MSQTVTMRINDETAEWLKTSARRTGRSVSEFGAGLVEEARRMNEFSEIEFRTFQGERHACLTGGLRLWKVIMVGQDYGMDAAKTVAHFGLPAWRIQAAINYYEAFPQEIDQTIQDNDDLDFEALKRRLPNLRLFEVAREVLEGEPQP